MEEPKLKNKEDLVHFRKEYLLLCGLKHDHVVNILSVDLEECFIIMDYAPYGSLRNVIETTEYVKLLTDDLKNKIVRDMVRGLYYLHKFGEMHGDLKSANILIYYLLQKRVVAKITDFDCAKNIEDLSTSPTGTLRWLAPEIASGESNTTKSDVYSFGIVIWEILHEDLPYNGEHEIAIILNIHEGRLPKCRKCNHSITDCHLCQTGQECPHNIICQSTNVKLKTLQSVYEKCTKKEPNDRPDLKEISYEVMPPFFPKLTLSRSSSPRPSPASSPRSPKGSYQSPNISPRSPKGSYQSPNISPALSPRSPKGSYQSPNISPRSPNFEDELESVSLHSDTSYSDIFPTDVHDDHLFYLSPRTTSPSTSPRTTSPRTTSPSTSLRTTSPLGTRSGKSRTMSPVTKKHVLRTSRYPKRFD